jgi:predicted N-formylglutamate amidohydrolase
VIVHTEEAWEQAGDVGGPFLFICEHASARIPPPLSTNSADQLWLQSHWGVDIGARGLTLALAQRTGSQAVLARFSRLLCDANRHRDHPDLIRQLIDGAPLSFNTGLDEAELTRRIETYHEPYHQACDRALAASSPPPVLVSLHSFTPVWNQKVRTMDVGVLFDEARSGTDARTLAAALQSEGFFTALNEPYSGANGLMYAADRHGQQHKLRHLELELNQSILCTPQRVEQVGKKIAAALMSLL